MSLQSLQAELAETILADAPCVETIIPSQNMRIYQNNVIATLLGMLQAIYPLITQLVGKEFFRYLANEYINQYPSCSGNLHEYGEYLKDLLAGHEAIQHLLYLPEVAEFEWICHRLQFAATHEALNLNNFKTISPEIYDQLHFILHPASELKYFQYPILRIIDLCKLETAEKLDVDHQPIHLLILRAELDIELIPLTLGEYTFLTAIRDHANLADAVDAAIAIDPVFDLTEKLSAWIENKTIVDYY